jgi:hypothetical protein
VHNDHGVPSLRYLMLIELVLLEIEIEEIRRHLCLDRALHTEHLTCDDFSLHSLAFEDRDLGGGVLLIARVAKLVLLIKV